MWGKHFESMYNGSMYGAGVGVFAVWGYVIAHARNGVVELNVRVLADTLGGKVEEVEKAIAYLTKPDPASRHKEHGGRRLIKEGEYQYRIPSWSSYQTMRNEEVRREYNRKKQMEYRAKDGKPLPGEKRYERIARREGLEAADRDMDQRGG
jgi:hypothetical protein